MDPRLIALLAIIPLAALAASLHGCKPKEERFESVCQLVHQEVVEQNDKGEPEVVDVELEWDPCPGDQFQYVRGGKDFAACLKKYPEGDLVPVKVLHYWDDRGYYAWDVYQVGDCKRNVEPDAEGSFEKSQECSDIKTYDKVNGFSCQRRPKKALVSVCPWTARD